MTNRADVIIKLLGILLIVLGLNFAVTGIRLYSPLGQAKIANETIKKWEIQFSQSDGLSDEKAAKARMRLEEIQADIDKIGRLPIVSFASNSQINIGVLMAVAGLGMLIKQKWAYVLAVVQFVLFLSVIFINHHFSINDKFSQAKQIYEEFREEYGRY